MRATQGDLEHDADPRLFNFALMMFNESPVDSGYPRKAFIRVNSANVTARAREYFFDGPIGAFQNTTASGAIVAQPDR